MKMFLNGRQYYLTKPNICSHCHVVNVPIYKWHIESLDIDDLPAIISVWECSNSECAKVFVAIYKSDDSSLSFDRFLNGMPKGPVWPLPILDLKSGKSVVSSREGQTKFIKTYLQSLMAENSGLDELAGMGYRKSIEYLVKDWAIKINPQDKEEIEEAWLSAVIKKYYDGDLQKILERATWLGNDQSHYNKIFEDFDIDVLKELIDLIMVELDRQFKMNRYINTIQKRK